MEIFEKLRSGIPVDMHSAEYRPVIEALHKNARILHHLNAAEPNSEEQQHWIAELFDGNPPEEFGLFTPAQIDFPNQMTIGRHVLLNHHFTAMSIGSIVIGDGSMIGPNCTIVTDNHNLLHKNILECKPVVIGKDVWIGACASIMPGVVIGDHAVIAGGANVVHDVPEGCIAAGNPARIIGTISERKHRETDRL